MTQSPPPTAVAAPQKGARKMKAAADLMTLMAGQVVTRLFGFLAFAYLARLMSHEKYGLVETAVAMASLGLTAVEFGTGVIGIRWIAGKEMSRAEAIRKVFSARILQASVVIPLLIAIYAFGAREPDLVPVLLLYGVSLMFAVMKQDWLFQAAEHMGVSAAGVGLKMATFFFALLIFSPKDNSIHLVGWAEVIAMAAMAIFFFIQQKRIVGVGLPRPSLSGGLTGVVRGAPFGFSGLINSVALSVPILVVQSFSTGEEAAQFGAAQRIVLSLVAIGWLYRQNLFPLLTRRIAQDHAVARELVYNSDLFTAWTTIAGCTGLFLMSEPLMSLTFGDSFAQAAPEFAFLIWFFAASLLGGSSRWLLIAQKQQGRLLIAQVIGAIVGCVAAIPLTLYWGGAGAAAGVTAGSICTWIICEVLVRKCAVRSRPDVLLLPVLTAIAAVAVANWLDLPAWIEGIGAMIAILVVGVLTPGATPALLKLAHAKQGD